MLFPGKSTLGGQILYLTGGVDKRTIEKYEREAKDKNRESWYMAYIMDTNEEERVKGITVEVGRAKFETEARRYTILDAPGHKNYVPNMIMGAAQVGCAGVEQHKQTCHDVEAIELKRFHLSCLSSPARPTKQMQEAWVAGFCQAGAAYALFWSGFL
jgi:translation elongation factor EF-4